jgi:hypothetical protein
MLPVAAARLQEKIPHEAALLVKMVEGLLPRCAPG